MKQYMCNLFFYFNFFYSFFFIFILYNFIFFFFSSRRRHTRSKRDWSSDVCSSDLSDRADPVPDEIWAEAARHYDERGLAALILMIATTNVYNRLNVTTRQVAGAWG